MSNFVETLNLLIYDKFKDAKSFADEIGVDPTCITRYLKGKRSPSLQNLLIIADYFKCSADYLLGLENYNPQLNFKQNPNFTESFNALLKEKHISCLAISKATPISVSSLYDWKSGKRFPDMNNLIQLAKFFDCRVDFLLGREN